MVRVGHRDPDAVELGDAHVGPPEVVLRGRRDAGRRARTPRRSRASRSRAPARRRSGASRRRGIGLSPRVLAAGCRWGSSHGAQLPLRGTAPTSRSASSPFRKSTSSGMLWAPWRAASSGARWTASLTTFRRPGLPRRCVDDRADHAARPAPVGPKSTSTGMSALIASSKSWASTSRSRERRVAGRAARDVPPRHRHAVLRAAVRAGDEAGAAMVRSPRPSAGPGRRRAGLRCRAAGPVRQDFDLARLLRRRLGQEQRQDPVEERGLDGLRAQAAGYAQAALEPAEAALRPPHPAGASRRCRVRPLAAHGEDVFSTSMSSLSAGMPGTSIATVTPSSVMITSAATRWPASSRPPTRRSG